MLQIISGKFYKSDKRYHNDCKGILYSNLSWSERIDTCVATIEAAECYGQISSYIISYDNQIEQPEVFTGFNIVKTGDREILGQLKLICSFALNCFFDEEKINVQNLCRQNAISSREYDIPSSYLTRTLGLGIHAAKQEIDDLIYFINKIIGLPRNIYKVIISCLQTYNNSIKALDTDTYLAYSMMVYCLESLSQRFDNYVPKWEDYNQNLKVPLERCFDSLDQSAVQSIKDILIKEQHLKLSKRFISFISQNLNEEFFTTEAFNHKRALQRTELEQTLQNAYTIRSKYVHALEPLIPQLSIASISRDSDVYEFLHDTFLTFSGLQRVTRKVIKNFIERQDSISEEEINWHNELPSVLQLEVAPQYWIWKFEGLKPEHMYKKYEGILEIIASGSKEFPDMRDVINNSTEFFNTATKPQKIQIYCVSKIYNSFITENFRSSNYEEFLKENSRLLDECCIENMALITLPLNIDHDIKWELVDCEEVIIKYNHKKFNSKYIKLPTLIETIMYLQMANAYNEESNVEKQKEWLQNALLNSAGKEILQKQIQSTIDTLEPFDMSNIYKILFSKEI